MRKQDGWLGLMQTGRILKTVGCLETARRRPARPPWRNRLARSAVNRKVGGSSPPGGELFCVFRQTVRRGENRQKLSADPGRTRTCNPLIRSQMPYPLGHRATEASWVVH